MFVLLYFSFAGVIKRVLAQGSSGQTFVATEENDETEKEIVLKMILLRGQKGSTEREIELKKLKDDVEVGMKISKESVFLVSYLDVFESGDYLCLKMEYCELRNLQNQLD
jgi:hypothetical protein